MDISYTRHPTEIPTDEDPLVLQAQTGDVYAFVKLYEEYIERVYRYVAFRVENDRVAENISVWVFSKAWEQLDRYRASGLSIIEWLYTIARNEIITYYRTHKRNAIRDDTVPLVVGSGDRSEDIRDMFDLQALRDGLQFLTGEEQQILILKFIAGLPSKNIARIMSMRENHVRAVQFRALHRLTAYLQEKEVV